MILRIPVPITRAFVHQHKECIFVYGIDMQCSSIQGQPFEFAGEPNAYPVPTLERYCPSQKTLFNDSLFTHYANIMDDAIDKIARDAFYGKKFVIVCPKIGMGCSRLHDVAPRLYAYMTKRLTLISHTQIKWLYPGTLVTTSYQEL